MTDTDKPLTFIEEARRKQIIESTILTLAEKGFINTSLTDIANQIGVTKGVISYHFNGKDDLISATLETIIKTQVSIRTKHIEKRNTPEGKLTAYIIANKVFLELYPNYMTALMELWASYSNPESRKEFNHAAYEPARAQLSQIFEQGQSNGSFKAFDNLLMAGLLQGSIDGITFQWIFDPSKVDLDKSFSEVTEIFLQRVMK